MARNDIAKEIWEFYVQKEVYILAALIPKIYNVTADVASPENTNEWLFYSRIFAELMRTFG